MTAKKPAAKHSAQAAKGKKPAAPAKPVKVAKPAAKAAVKAVPKPTRSTKPAAKPVPSKPAPAKPAVAKAAAAKPAVAKAATAKPAAPAVKPGAAKPAAPAVKPGAAKPAAPAAKPAAPKPSGGVVARGVRINPRPLPTQPVDGEDGEDSSLLAGPRNVQPYVVQRGEQYMSREQLEHFRAILEAWKRDLMVEVDRTVSHMKDEAANFPDPNDRATQEEEFSLELRTRDRERKLIRKIEEALQRIEDGSYGYCLETGEEIGIKRLEARPVATLCLEAQERRERREKQYGDRDDRYR